jgi:ATP-dependent RNA helicase SUPV3L1/SUV3
MTSLTGSAGEDFASVLRALGYRMERRPALPPAPAPAVVAADSNAAVTAVDAESVDSSINNDVARAEAQSSAPHAGYAPAANDNEPVSVESHSEPVATLEAQPDAAAPINVQPDSVAPAEAENEAEPAPVEAEAVVSDAQPVVDITADSAAASSAATIAAEVSSPVAPPPETAEAAAPEAATPEMVDVWRPGGRSDERRPRHDRNRHRHQNKPQEGAQPVAAEGEAGDGAKRERHGRGRRDRNNDSSKPRTDAQTQAVAAPADGAPAQEPRDSKDRPPRERFQGKGRDQEKSQGKFQGKSQGKFQGKPRGDREGRSGGGPSHRQYASSAPPRERERPADPNSPFAKLAALKEQLAAARKD